MERSKFLGKVIGVYLIIVGVTTFMNIHQFLTYANNLMNDASLLFVTGFFTVILGILMVVSHNIWQWNWRVIITIISWLVLLKGISILLCPVTLNKMTLQLFQDENRVYIATVIDFVIGVLLCYFGFRR